MIPEPINLAIIATPAATVPAIIAQCVAAGVRGAVIISAGFRERGPDGAALERDVIVEARRAGIRIVGPKRMGLMVPSGGLNAATFATGSALPGRVAFLSQSGALGSAILDWSIGEKIGFSAFVSVGSMVDVSWADLLDYFSDDPATKAITLYMESIGDTRSFLSTSREVALSKPIIVVKAGRTAQAAAASHTRKPHGER